MKAIVIYDLKRGIAKDGDQPIHIPADLRRFSKLTKDQTVIMGRKTAEVIGKPLPDRNNIVITSDPAKFAESYEGYNPMTVVSLKNYINRADTWVIGGAMIYSLLLNCCAEVYVTEVQHDFKCDQFFPRLTKLKWKIIDQTDPVTYVDTDGNEYNYRFLTYKRR